MTWENVLQVGMELILKLGGQILDLAQDTKANKISADEAAQRLGRLINSIDAIPDDMRLELTKRLRNHG